MYHMARTFTVLDHKRYWSLNLATTSDTLTKGTVLPQQWSIFSSMEWIVSVHDPKTTDNTGSQEPLRFLGVGH